MLLPQVLNGKEDALHLASQHMQADEGQRSMRGFLCPTQPSQAAPSSDSPQTPVAAAGESQPANSSGLPVYTWWAKIGLS